MFSFQADSATLLKKVASELRRLGARRVFGLVTHGIFSGGDVASVTRDFDAFAATNTVDQTGNLPHIKEIDVSEAFAEAIRRTAATFFHGAATTTNQAHVQRPQQPPQDEQCKIS